MGDSARSKARQSGRRAKRRNGRGGEKSYEPADLIRALNHPLRRQILHLLHSSEDPLSPTEIERMLKLGFEPKERLSTVSYHVGMLRDCKVISMVGQQQVRGAMEHFYVSEVSKDSLALELLKRTQKSDEARLWPKGEVRTGRKTTRKTSR